MAGIRLEFAQFSHFDSFDVIRSLSSIATLQDNELPTPIATGLKTMYYVDANVVEGATYYYRVRVWRGSQSFVSGEIRSIARIYHVLLSFNASGIVKDGTSSITFSNSGCTFQQMADGSYAAKFTNQNTYLFSNGASQVAGDYELEYVFTPLGWSSSMSPIYDSRRDSYDLANGVIHGLQAGGIRIEHRNASGAYTGWSQINVTPNLVNGTKYKITLRRVGNIWTLLLNDVFVGTRTDPSPVPALANQTFIGRVKDGNAGYYLNGFLHQWSIRQL